MRRGAYVHAAATLAAILSPQARSVVGPRLVMAAGVTHGERFCILPRLQTAR